MLFKKSKHIKHSKQKGKKRKQKKSKKRLKLKKEINNNNNNKEEYNIIMYSFYNEDDNTHTKEKNRCMCVDYDIKNNSYDLENNQDYRRCKNTVKTGTNFCSKHQQCMNYLKLFTNNHESDYDSKEWSHPYIEGSHNCYSYFLNDKQETLKQKCHKMCKKKHNDCPRKLPKCGNFKPQPGDYYLLMKDGHLNNKKREYKCPNMEKKIIQDNSSIKKTSLFEKCPNKYYKGAMVIDPDHTFHFYRQNKNGLWSHKPGTMKVTDIDADNKKIPIPHFANRDYSNKPNKIKYTDFCGYYCIPNNDYLKTNSS